MAASEKRPAGFFLYPERVRAVCAMLTPGDAGRLLQALCDYVETGETPVSRKKAFIACFALLREDIDRDAARYREICDKRRESANRRWHGESFPPDACASLSMLKDAYPTQPNPTQPYPTQPYPTQPNPTQPNPSQPNPTQPNPAQPNPAQPRPAQPRPTQPRPAHPGAAPAARPIRANVKGESHDQSGNSCPLASKRGTVL